MSDCPLLEAPRISLASSFSLNGWKTATQAVSRDTIPFQHVLVQVGSFLKFLFPLNCRGTGREWKEYQVESHNSSLESGSSPDLLSFLFCWKSKATCSLLTCLGKCLLGPRQYSSSGISIVVSSITTAHTSKSGVWSRSLVARFMWSQSQSMLLAWTQSFSAHIWLFGIPNGRPASSQ